MEIEFACEEVSHGYEVLDFIPTGHAFGGLYGGVEAFENAIIDLGLFPSDDAVPVA